RVPAQADPDVEAAAGELIQGGEALREVDRAPERREQDRGPEPDPAGQRSGPREELHGLEARERAQHLLHDPDALEAEGLRPLEEASDTRSVDAAGRPGLGNAR